MSAVHPLVESTDLPVPDPVVSPDTAVFWEAAARGELLIKRCSACGETYWYPRPICPLCHSTNTVWEPASGRGTVYSFSIVRRGSGAYAKRAPYVLAYVDLVEGPRLMTNIVDCAAEEVTIGQEVEVVFHRAPGGTALPRFRPLNQKLLDEKPLDPQPTDPEPVDPNSLDPKPLDPKEGTER
jgi:uncharacterized OB-fold protein